MEPEQVHQDGEHTLRMLWQISSRRDWCHMINALAAEQLAGSAERPVSSEYSARIMKTCR